MYESCQHGAQCYILANRKAYRSCLDCCENQKDRILFSDLVKFQADIINVIKEIKKDKQQLDDNISAIQNSFPFFKVSEYESMLYSFQGYDEKLLDFYLNKKYQKQLKLKKKLIKDINKIIQKGKNHIYCKIKTYYQLQQKDALQVEFPKQQKIEYMMESSSNPIVGSLITHKTIGEEEKLLDIDIQDYFQFNVQYKMSSVTFLNENLMGIAFENNLSFTIYNTQTKQIQHTINQPEIYDSWRINDYKFIVGQGNTIKIFNIDNNLQILNDNIQFLNSSNKISKIVYHNSIKNTLITFDNKNCIRQTTFINQWDLDTGQVQEYKIKGKANEIINVSSIKQLFVSSTVRNKELKKSFKLMYQIELWRLDGNQKRIDKKKVDQQINSLCLYKFDQLIGFGKYTGYIWQIGPNKGNQYRLLSMKTIQINVLNINKTLYINETIYVGTTDGKLLKLLLDQDNSHSEQETLILDLKVKIVKISTLNNLNVISSENNKVVIFKGG